jgi:Flp pilus assembly protein TadG
LFPLVLLVFGTIEFSTLLYDKAMITNASREGARAGIVFSDPRIPDGDIVNVVSTYCGDHMISLGADSSVSTTITRTGDASGDTLTVRVSYAYNFLVLPNLMTSLSDGLLLQAETVMRLE